VTYHDQDLSWGLLACCADIYGHPLARWFLGDSLHPGGLALSRKLTSLLNLGPWDRALDLGSGRGVSAVHLARTVGCRVMGVTLEPSGVSAGRELARQQGVHELADFVQGDWNHAPLRPGSFDAVIAECVLSILPDKTAALGECYRLLRPGGRLGLTDVVLNGSLPRGLDGLLATAGCLGGALSLAQYQQVVEAAGFEMECRQDLPDVASEFLRNISGKLLMAEAAAALGKVDLPGDLVLQAKSLLSKLREGVDSGVVGYGLVTAHRRVGPDNV
jgi:arsenite methyltransferase